MSKMIALSVIIDDRKDDNKFVQAYVAENSIVAIQEDLDDENCCYILLSSGHDMHINLSLKDLHSILNR